MLRDPQRCLHTAFLLKNTNIIEIATNIKKTHPMNFRYNYRPLKNGVCAELSVVLKSRMEIFNRHTLIVTRVDRNGLLNYSKPCEGCLHLIDQLRFKEVWYSVNEQNYERL